MIIPKDKYQEISRMFDILQRFHNSTGYDPDAQDRCRAAFELYLKREGYTIQDWEETVEARLAEVFEIIGK